MSKYFYFLIIFSCFLAGCSAQKVSTTSPAAAYPEAEDCVTISVISVDEDIAEESRFSASIQRENVLPEEQKLVRHHSSTSTQIKNNTPSLDELKKPQPEKQKKSKFKQAVTVIKAAITQDDDELEEEENWWAIASLVLGILGIVMLGLPPFSILAVVAGVIGIRREKLRGMAWAGLILGIAGILFFLVMLALYILFWIMLANINY